MHAIEQEIKDFIRYWTFPYLRPRRFHAFGVGAPKSGTHSLASVFGRYRRRHEPERERFMQIIMARADGAVSVSRAQDQVRRLDRRKWPELNASYLNYFLLDLLLDEYPQAKFVLTIRDCYSWLDSVFNQLLGRTHEEFQTRFHSWYLESMSPGSHEAGDRILAERGLWPLAQNQRRAKFFRSRFRRTLTTIRLTPPASKCGRKNATPTNFDMEYYLPALEPGVSRFVQHLIEEVHTHSFCVF